VLVEILVLAPITLSVLWWWRRRVA
jgi:hypothetical protein